MHRPRRYATPRRQIANLEDETPTPDIAQRDVIGLIGIPVLLVAFFLQPQIASASVTARGQYLVAAMIGFTGLMFARGFVRHPVWRTVASIAVLGSVAALISISYPAQKRSERANERRCLAIQRDMLSARPRRPDGPDLFQALGCRAQGEGSVYRTPSAAERRAGHSLP